MARSSQRSCVVHRRDATICGEHPEIRLSQLCFCNQSYSSQRGEYSFINRVYGSRGTNGLTGSRPTKCPMWGYPRPVLGAVDPFLEPFRGRLSPNIDNVSEKLTLRYPHEGPWVVLGPLRCGPVGIEPTAAERGASNLKGFPAFWRTNGSSQVQIQDLTVLCVPNSLNSGERLRVGWLQGFNSL